MEKLKTDLPDVEVCEQHKCEHHEVEKIKLPDDFNIYSDGTKMKSMFVYNKPIGPVSYNHACKFYNGMLVVCERTKENNLIIYAIVEDADDGVAEFCKSKGIEHTTIIYGPLVGHLYPMEEIYD